MPTVKTPTRPAAVRAVPRKSARPAAPAAERLLTPTAKRVKPANRSKPQSAAKAMKAAKPPKLRTKPVRDSFTMPEADFALIATLKARTMSARRETKKSELLRAGLHALAALDTVALVAALGALEPVKIGRPKSGS